MINSLKQSIYCWMFVIASPGIFSQEFTLEVTQKEKITHYTNCKIHRQTLYCDCWDICICADVPNFCEFRMTNGAMYTSERTENFNKGNNGGSRAERTGVCSPLTTLFLSWQMCWNKTKTEKQRINEKNEMCVSVLFIACNTFI